MEDKDFLEVAKEFLNSTLVKCAIASLISMLICIVAAKYLDFFNYGTYIFAGAAAICLIIGVWKKILGK